MKVLLITLIASVLFFSESAVNGLNPIFRRGVDFHKTGDKKRLHHMSSGSLDFSSPSSSALSLIISNKLRGRSDATKITTLNMMMEGVTALDAALKSGPLGVLSLTCIASLAAISLALFCQVHSVSAGHRHSVFAMAYAIARAFNININSVNALSLLASAAMFCGARLGACILLRDWTVPSRSLKKHDKTSHLKRTPFAIAVSMFYVFMACPLMCAARAVSLSEMTFMGKKGVAMNVEVGLALLGAVMEAIADGQKYWVKRCNTLKNDKFSGPTGGFCRLCRHLNYFAEALCWFGLFVAGMPSFDKSPIAWMCASLGFYGVLRIMKGASKRLDAKQVENHKGQEDYEKYREQVHAILWPWMKN